jgi:hypothetical protein
VIENRLRDLLHAAPPGQGPALQGTAVLSRARTRLRRRRQAVLVAAGAVALLGGVAIAAGVRTSPTQPTSPSTTPCASPFAGSDTEQSVAFPHDGSRVEVTIPVFGHVTVGWSGCGEHGTIASSDPDGSTAPASATDVSVYTSPRPVPSGVQGGCCARPEADGVFNVRYSAKRPGTVTLRGTGSQGSSGTIVIHVEPLGPSESRAISGVVDTSALRAHPGAEFVQLLEKVTNGRVAIALVSADGTFSLRLPPGTYGAEAFSPSYNDGRVRCAATSLVVGDADVSNVTIVCTERS